LRSYRGGPGLAFLEPNPSSCTSCGGSPRGGTSPCTSPCGSTAVCRIVEDKGTCLYGYLCQFAHGKHELRSDVVRHNKYKTKLCQKFWTTGYCTGSLKIIGHRGCKGAPEAFGNCGCIGARCPVVATTRPPTAGAGHRATRPRDPGLSPAAKVLALAHAVRELAPALRTTGPAAYVELAAALASLAKNTCCLGRLGRRADKGSSNMAYRSANTRFKIEVCRNFKNKSTHLSGYLCQFAHGKHELRSNVVHRNKYKTKLCQKYQIAGCYAYGLRCNFTHLSWRPRFRNI
jgi:butyrate response factor 1